MNKADGFNSYRYSLFDIPISRRSVIKLMGFGAAALSLPGCSSILRKNIGEREDFLVGVSPIDRTLGDIAPRGFSGDNPDRTHRILWDKEGYIASKGGKFPSPVEKVPLVIIGGGMSGLFSAYLLKHYHPILLERADRFGGNARGESWNGIDYSIGAAYCMEPNKGSPLYNLLMELGIDQMYRLKDTEDPIIYNQKRYNRFWDGETSPADSKQFRKLRRYLEEIYENANGRVFPDIPITDPDKRKYVEDLDRVTFKRHLEQMVGGALHSHIETALEHFCWSSFGASFSEISAAAGLNFYAGEFGNVFVIQGGNSAIAERILERLISHQGTRNLRPRSIVFDVDVVSDGVHVTYVDANDELRTIHAQAVILACPKFAVARMLRGIEPERLDTIRSLKYHSYLVANVLLKKALPNDFYDLFLIGKGRVNSKDIAGSSERQKVTDVVLGTYARFHQDRSVLTLYRGMPYVGGRGQIYADGAYDKYRREFETQLHESLLPLVGAKKEDVIDVRVSRWGHPLPMAQAGLIASGAIDQIRKPFRERVFFVEQDNWMLPAFETASGEAITWAPIVERFLKKGV